MSVTSYVVVALDELVALRASIGRELDGDHAPAGRQQDVALLATELVTNALTHAGAPAAVRIELTGHDIRVGVHDVGSGTAVVQPKDPHRIGGNGLRIVEALADAWGSDPSPDGGKEIWFRIAW